MTPKTREERLEHNLRGLIAVHAGLKRKHGETVDERFLLQLLEPKEGDDAVTTENGSGDEVALGWGGRKLRVRGLAAIIVLGLFVALGGMLWLGYQSVAALTVQVDKARTEHQQLGESLEALIYVYTLSDTERRALRLRVPDKIRDLERR